MYFALVGTSQKAGQTPAGWAELGALETAFYDALLQSGIPVLMGPAPVNRR
jgi:hypothetical protein